MLRRSMPVLAVLSLVAACGDDPDNATGLPVLRVGSSATAGGAEGAPAAADSMMTGEKAMYVPANWEFVVNGELPSLDTDAPAYSFTRGVEPEAARLDALLEVFGMEGSFVRTTNDAGTDYEWTTWSVGPSDGSGPSITVSDDGMLTWWYSEGWQEMATARPAPCSEVSPSESLDSSSGDSATTSPDDACPDEWVEPTPPENVPSAADAESKFRKLFEQLGFASDELLVESYGDDWSAGAWGYVLIDGVRSSLTMSASFGENGRLTYAGGYLGRPEPIASYPRIGTTAGLDRLRSEYGGMMGRAMIEPAIDDTSVVVDDTATVPSTTTEVSEPASTDVTSVQVDPMPIVPDASIVPETITVEIIDVEEEYILYWSVDGDVYLVPGYSFVATEDEWGYSGRYTVAAIPSEYLDIVQPPVVDEPLPVEPEPALPGDDDVIGISVDDAEQLLGKSESDAIAFAESEGWAVRVVARDGEEFPITMDYSTGRVNLTVENDLVTEVYVG